jgi:hypothetical protein
MVDGALLLANKVLGSAQLKKPKRPDD